MSHSLHAYLFVSTALLAIGVYGLLARRNLVAILISLELILNSASVNFLAFNRFCLADKALGQTFVIFVIALAAAEVCIALSLILALYRGKDSIDVEAASEVRG